MHHYYKEFIISSYHVERYASGGLAQLRIKPPVPAKVLSSLWDAKLPAGAEIISIEQREHKTPPYTEICLWNQGRPGLEGVVDEASLGVDALLSEVIQAKVTRDSRLRPLVPAGAPEIN